MSAASVRAEAKRLLALSLEGGAVSSDRVGAVLAALAKSRPAHTLRPLLRAYLANVRRELTRGEARIEHAGPLSAADAPRPVRMGCGIMTFDTVPGWGLGEDGRSVLGSTHGGVAVDGSGTIWTSSSLGIFGFAPDGKVA